MAYSISGSQREKLFFSTLQRNSDWYIVEASADIYLLSTNITQFFSMMSNLLISVVLKPVDRVDEAAHDENRPHPTRILSG